MNRRRYSWLLHLVLVLTAGLMTGCFPVSWEPEPPVIPQSSLPHRPTSEAGPVLVLPFWQNYKNESYKYKFYITNPVFLDNDDLADLSANLDGESNVALVYLFMHPSWLSSHTLEELYFVYPDGRLVRITQGITGEPPWPHRECAWLGHTWRQELTHYLKLKKVDYGAITPRPDRLFRLPRSYVDHYRKNCQNVDEPWFEADDYLGRKTIQFCFHNRLLIKMTREERQSMSEAVDQIPPVTGQPTDMWSDDCEGVGFANGDV